MEGRLAKRVEEALAAEDGAGALWGAQWLVAVSPRFENRVVLARVLMRERRYAAVYGELRECGAVMTACPEAVEARQMLYGACLKMNKVQEGIQLAEEHQTQPGASPSSYEYALVGQLYRTIDCKSKAIAQFQQSLDLEPMQWSAIQGLCAYGALEMEQCRIPMLHHDSSMDFRDSDTSMAAMGPGRLTFHTPASRLRSTTTYSEASGLVTPSPSLNTTISFATPLPPTLQTTPASFDRDGMEHVYHICVEAYMHLQRFELNEALSLLESVEHSCKARSPWILNMLGRCYFEQSEYAKACDFFREAFHSGSHPMEGLVLYSSCLWQLKRTTELTALAQTIVDLNVMSSEAWIVLGNCYSLEKEHEEAITYFQRAASQDPSCAYAHSLLGHEFMSMGKLEDATSSYRKALKADFSHYIAWYGLGSIYLQQKRHDIATHHFRKAISINGQNALLNMCLGIALLEQDETQAALDQFECAIELQPRNAQAKYQRAAALFKLGREKECLSDLNDLLQLAPREASVHILLGKLYKEQKHLAQAAEHFTTAIALDAKEKATVEPLMEGLRQET